MIVSLYLEKHEYLIKEPQTMNFGGQYLYSFHPNGKKLIVKRQLNDKYIPDFFNISASSINIELLSAIVGENGMGKSSILDVFRWIFIDKYFVGPNTRATVLIEVGSETKVLQAPYFEVHVEELKNKEVKLKKISRAKTEDFQTIYYSPHFDLKYNQNSDPFDKYEISLDQFIKDDLENLDERGSNESGYKYALQDELLFKNAIRQIGFLSSEIFSTNYIFREVFNLPEYKTGILYFRDLKIPHFNNLSFELRSVIEVVLEKLEKESGDSYNFRNSIANLDRNKQQAAVNKYLLERFVIKAFLSISIDQMEKDNTYFEEATIDDGYNINKFDNLTVKKDNPAKTMVENTFE